MTCNGCIPIKIYLAETVIFCVCVCVCVCVCEVIQVFSLVFCVVGALHIFEFRLVIKEETTSYSDRGSFF